MQSCNTCPHCHHLRGGDNQRALHQRCGYERIHKNDHLECPAKARLVAQEPPTFGSAWKSHATPLLMSMHAPMDGEMRAPSPAMHAGCALMRSSRARTKCPRQILGRSSADCSISSTLGAGAPLRAQRGSSRLREPPTGPIDSTRYSSLTAAWPDCTAATPHESRSGATRPCEGARRR